MSVYSKNEKYYCRFQINGERHHYLCNGAKSTKEAKLIEDGFRYKIQQQQNGVIPENSQYIPLHKILKIYSKYAEINNKDNTHKNSKISVIKEFFGASKDVTKIKQTDIEEFRTFLRDKKKLTATTINKYVCVLSKAYNLAIQNDLVVKNPCCNIKKLKENNEILRYLTIEEEKRLYSVLPPHIEPIITCALQTGLRRSNILNLRWEQIDFDFRVIEIEKQENKGHKQIIIPITEKLMNVFKTIGIKECGYVFINPDTGKPYSTIRKSWISALKRADIKNFRFHDLRHTVGTRLIEKGVDIKTVQELFAHSSIVTTQRYVHTNFTRKRNAMNVLNSYSENITDTTDI